MRLTIAESGPNNRIHFNTKGLPGDCGPVDTTGSGAGIHASGDSVAS